MVVVCSDHIERQAVAQLVNRAALEHIFRDSVGLRRVSGLSLVLHSLKFLTAHLDEHSRVQRRFNHYETVQLFVGDTVKA